MELYGTHGDNGQISNSRRQLSSNVTIEGNSQFRNTVTVTTTATRQEGSGKIRVVAQIDRESR